MKETGVSVSRKALRRIYIIIAWLAFMTGWVGILFESPFNWYAVVGVVGAFAYGWAAGKWTDDKGSWDL